MYDYFGSSVAVSGSTAVVGASTTRLGSPQVPRPRTEWVIVPGAHQSIVDPTTFARAQEILAHLTLHKTNEQVLDELRSLLKAEGKLSGNLINNTPGMACARTFWRRFGSVRKAFELIGYDWLKERRRRSDAQSPPTSQSSDYDVVEDLGGWVLSTRLRTLPSSCLVALRSFPKNRLRTSKLCDVPPRRPLRGAVCE